VLPSFPPLPAELAEFVQGGVSINTGTVSPDLVPESVRAVGVRVWPCACKLTVFLPKSTAEFAIENMRASKRVAVTMSQVETYRTVQVKGSVLAIREANEDDREVIERYAAAFRKSLAWIGLPEGVTRGLSIWPAWAIDQEIVHVFSQTPGPMAGVRMPLSPDAKQS
jgi:hypothetical protein